MSVAAMSMERDANGLIRLNLPRILTGSVNVSDCLMVMEPVTQADQAYALEVYLLVFNHLKVGPLSVQQIGKLQEWGTRLRNPAGQIMDNQPAPPTKSSRKPQVH